ncbi:duodenase-1-like [Misgurnus anguillicaudatus]|uniref:duodenase-1-like n=1 Tax=Misgurnus anguillicaudatus TaxID=75329 RepID=UPI003CCF0E00
MIIITLLLLGSLVPNLSFTASVKVRLVNGTEAKPHSRPYMVSVAKNGRHICAGFLISDQFVLTAAHCRDEVRRPTANGSPKRVIPVRASGGSTPHPRFPSQWGQLNKKVKLNNQINTIPIPPTPVKIRVDTNCSVAGWGFVTNSGPQSPTLREANVKIIKNTDCAARWDWVYEASQMMCVYGHGGSCDGDSGGPLVCNNIAVGVTAFVSFKSCNDPNLPNVYTKISAFLPWIQSILKTK